MWWHYQAGIVAARRQLIAVLLVIFTLSLLTSYDLIGQGALDVDSDDEGLCTSLSQFLKWTFVIVALGLAWTSTPSVNLSAHRIRRAFRIMRRIPVEHASRVLAFQLGLATLILVAFTVRMPPEALIGIARYLGYGCAASIGWAGTISISVSYFGACTHAVLKAT